MTRQDYTVGLEIFNLEYGQSCMFTKVYSPIRYTWTWEVERTQCPILATQCTCLCAVITCLVCSLVCHEDTRTCFLLHLYIRIYTCICSQSHVLVRLSEYVFIWDCTKTAQGTRAFDPVVAHLTKFLRYRAPSYDIMQWSPSTAVGPCCREHPGCTSVSTLCLQWMLQCYQ